MTASNLSQPATADLTETESLAEMARREEWDADRYALTLAENIRFSAVPLDRQRERLAQLARVGAGLSLSADRATAEALAQHYAVLEALAQRFANEALKALQGTGPRVAEVADKYAAASMKAFRAAMSTLSALKTVRDAQSGAYPVNVSTDGQDSVVAPDNKCDGRDDLDADRA